MHEELRTEYEKLTAAVKPPADANTRIKQFTQTRNRHRHRTVLLGGAGVLVGSIAVATVVATQFQPGNADINEEGRSVAVDRASESDRTPVSSEADTVTCSDQSQAEVVDVDGPAYPSLTALIGAWLTSTNASDYVVTSGDREVTLLRTDGTANAVLQFDQRTESEWTVSSIVSCR